MRVIARIVADQLERDVIVRERGRAREETAAIDALLGALRAIDRSAPERSRLLADHAVALARALELPETDVADAEHVALLHDLGVVGIAAATAAGEPQHAIARRAQVGEGIVAGVDALAHRSPAMRALGERWDGGGAPDGLSGAQIPIAARIVRACGEFDLSSALTAAAHEALARQSGTILDPGIVEALLRDLT